MIKTKMSFIIFLFIFNFFYIFPSQALNLEKGKILFLQNCIGCHKGGNNLIIPEKNLKKLTLETNGMYSIEAITYQVLNGKNGMPAFGGRLREEEIENIAEYVIFSSDKNFDL